MASGLLVTLLILFDVLSIPSRHAVAFQTAELQVDDGNVLVLVKDEFTVETTNGSSFELLSLVRAQASQLDAQQNTIQDQELRLSTLVGTVNELQQALQPSGTSYEGIVSTSLSRAIASITPVLIEMHTTDSEEEAMILTTVAAHSAATSTLSSTLGVQSTAVKLHSTDVVAQLGVLATQSTVTSAAVATAQASLVTANTRMSTIESTASTTKKSLVDLGDGSFGRDLARCF